MNSKRMFPLIDAHTHTHTRLSYLYCQSIDEDISVNDDMRWSMCIVSMSGWELQMALASRFHFLLIIMVIEINMRPHQHASACCLAACRFFQSNTRENENDQWLCLNRIESLNPALSRLVSSDTDNGHERRCKRNEYERQWIHWASIDADGEKAKRENDLTRVVFEEKWSKRSLRWSTRRLFVSLRSPESLVRIGFSSTIITVLNKRRRRRRRSVSFLSFYSTVQCVLCFFLLSFAACVVHTSMAHFFFTDARNLYQRWRRSFQVSLSLSRARFGHSHCRTI